MKTIIKTSSFGKADKQLQISDSELVYNGVSIKLDEITAFKYGIESIQFDMFAVGRKYVVDVISTNAQIKLVFKSYFRFSETYFVDLFNNLVELVLNKVADRLLDESIAKVLNGAPVEVGNCVVSKEGITLKDFLIKWPDLSYQRNYDRLTVNSNSNPSIWTNLYYLESYNSVILLALLTWVFKHNGLAEIENTNIANAYEA